MIPAGSPSSVPRIAEFVSPDDVDRDLLTDYERGGTAVNDAALGLNVKSWRCYYDKPSKEVRLSNVNGTQQSVAFVADQITELSFTFDQLMRPMFAFVQATVAKFRWFDPIAAATVVDVIPGAVTSPFLALDDRRDVLIGSSDTVLFYIRDGGVYYRLQRERFSEEHQWAATLPPGITRILRVGMNRGNRFQVHLQTVSAV